ncbi:MAG TPA: LptA/OstA family protein [Alphaproteobacteria bacterium]|nr:LptA/OstA family protein [Alphaproteobacteria bacterium]
MARPFARRWRGAALAATIAAALPAFALAATSSPAPAAPPAATTAAKKPQGSAPASEGAGGAHGVPSILGSGTEKGGAPVAVEADQGIEWQQDKQLYIARGNAKATRGDITVYGQVLKAYYRKTSAGGSDIWRLEANDAVKITSPNETVVGDRAVYDVDNGVFVLTGKHLRLDSPKAVITARDSLEYWQKQQYAVARGDATATREDKTVRANVLEAHFKPDAKGQLQIADIEAFQNVQITTQSAVARAMYGDYNLDSGIARLKGSVKITRGTDQLDGECAEFNLNTNISRIYSCDKREQVRGLLVPKKGEEPQGFLTPSGTPPEQAPGGGKRN